MLTYWSEDDRPGPEHYLCVWCNKPLSVCDCHPQHGQWMTFRLEDEGEAVGWVLIDRDVSTRLQRAQIEIDAVSAERESAL